MDPGALQVDDDAGNFFNKFGYKNQFYLFVIKGKYGEPLAKLLKARGRRHSGQAKRDPESSIFEQFWIPASLENAPCFGTKQGSDLIPWRQYEEA